MRDELLLYFARLKVEAYSVEVDLDFVSWELQIDHCFCSAVKKKKRQRTVLDAHDIPREMWSLRKQVTVSWT